MTSSTKWMVAVFAVVTIFGAGMLWGGNVASELNPRNILASFDGLPEGDTDGTATPTQLTLPGASPGVAGVPKPLPQVGGNNLLLNPGGGNVGIGTTNPQSTLQVNGYVQLDLTSDFPPSLDCDEASEQGRMKADSGLSKLYVCFASGWRALSPSSGTDGPACTGTIVGRSDKFDAENNRVPNAGSFVAVSGPFNISDVTDGAGMYALQVPCGIWVVVVRFLFEQNVCFQLIPNLVVDENNETVIAPNARGFVCHADS